MPYKISGNINKDATIVVIDESDYSVTSSTTSSGGFSVSNLVSDSNKIVVCRASDGEAYGFSKITPTEDAYGYLNNFDLNSYDYVYWLDANNGSDDNDGLSINHACQTWEGMYNKMDSGSTNQCCILLPGTYNGSQGYSTDLYGSFIPRAQTHYIAAVPGEVTLENYPDSGCRDAPMFFYDNYAHIYGVIFRHYVGTRDNNYKIAFCKTGSVYFHNCGFTYSNRSYYHWSSLMYDNTQTTYTYYYNCTFRQSSWKSCYSNGGHVYIYDSLSQVSLACGNRSNTNEAESGIINYAEEVYPRFYTPDNTIQGVYSGQYAWPEPIV